MSRPVVGVDPGGKTTGVVVRQDDAVITAELVHNDATAVTDRYLAHVIDAVFAARLWALELGAGDPLVGVEDLTHPNPHVGRVANVMGLLGTAQVIGAIRGALRSYCPVVMVPPGKHGSAPLRAYPAVLVGSRETGTFGNGKYRHVRSAYDIAGATKAAALRTSRASL
jgi:hypothetical protein